MLAYILVIFGFVSRLIPHVPNLAPIAAIALFSGAYLDKRIVPWVPLAIMALTDMIIGFHSVVPYTWGAFILVGYIGMWLGQKRTVGRVFSAAVLSSLLFFVISNFGVAIMWYPHTIEGFISCYVKAIPFFRTEFLGNIVFVAILFGSYELARKLAEKYGYRGILFAK